MRKIINAGEEDAKYVINVKQIAVRSRAWRKSPDGRGGGHACRRRSHQVFDSDPVRPIDPTVSLMTVEDKPDVRRGRRRQGEPGEAAGGRRAAPAPPGALPHARHRPAQGGALLRAAGHGQDAERARGREPHGRLLHPRHRERARPEVRRRRPAHGPRALHDGALEEACIVFFDEVDATGGGTRCV